MLGKMIESGIIKLLEKFIDAVHGRDQTQPDLSSQIVLGRVAHSFHPERFEKASLDEESRLKHVYILGGTGSGKTKLIESMVRQSVLSKQGVLVIDPHGDLTQNILSFLAANFNQSEMDELGRRLILIEPFNREFAIGFNPLEAIAGHFPAMLELVEIFRRFWGNGWGPRMDEVFRHALVTLSENNLTLLEARPLLTNQDFRQDLLQHVSFREVRDYWLYRYNPLSEKMQALYREPVLNKISTFTTDPAIYRILGQTQSTVNFRQAMDQGKWVLLSLSTGHLKENAHLLGTLFLAKLKQAALSRIDLPEESRRPFYIFLDEFQNFIGQDPESLLSEGRKFRVAFGAIAHQSLDQLPRELASVILSNVGTEIVFRLSHRDASQISSEMDPKEKSLIEKRLIDLKTAQAYLKIKGQKPRLLKTLYVPPIQVSDEALDRVKLASFRHWAKPIAEVEREIEARRNLWQSRQAGERLTPKVPEARSQADQGPLTPKGSFEEGQNEW
jgi:hypothetical protein